MKPFGLFKYFSEMSGLKMINNKTRVIWIGSKKTVTRTVFKGYEFLLGSRHLEGPKN